MNNTEIEKAIEQLKTQINSTSCEISIKSCELAISALQQQLNNGWIPVSEKLPLSNMYHVIYATLKYEESGVSFSTKLFWDCGELKWFNGRKVSEKYEFVAWKRGYMPEPYTPNQPSTDTP